MEGMRGSPPSAGGAYLHAPAGAREPPGSGLLAYLLSMDA